MESTKLFSFFRKPITNKVPAGEVSLFDVYQYVKCPEARPETEMLRTIIDEHEQREYKGRHFDYITPGGVFSYCSDSSLIKESGILCVDLDHIGDVDSLKHKLIIDPNFNTPLLFRSPRGQGIKWFVEIDSTKGDYKTWYAGVRNYLMTTYSLTEEQVDKSCSNVSHPCYLSHDPEVYLRTDLIENFCI